MPLARSRILLQSSTASRTLPRTARSRAEISSRSASEATRSISRCIHDSVTTPNSSGAGGLVVVDVLQSPDGVAPDDELRVDDEVDGAVQGASAAVTESTRNGMSSVTTSTMVCPLAHPCDSMLGFVTATFTVPTARCRARSRSASAAPSRSSGSRASRSSVAVCR